eukprot:tig00020660_g12533.t2
MSRSRRASLRARKPRPPPRRLYTSSTGSRLLRDRVRLLAVTTSPHGAAAIAALTSSCKRRPYTRTYVITDVDKKTQALDALYAAFRNGTATLQSGPKSCLVMPAPPAPIAAPPAPQLPEDDDQETPKRRSGGRQAVVVSSDESDNASAAEDDPIEVSSDEEGAAPELDAAEAPVVKKATAPKKATGMKGLLALARARLPGTKAMRLLGAGVSKGKKTKKTAAPKAAKSKTTKGGKKTKAV